MDAVLQDVRFAIRMLIKDRSFTLTTAIAVLRLRAIHLCHMGHTITVRLDRDLAEWLEHESVKTGVSQGKIIRDQLERAKAAASAQTFMRLAGVVRGGARDVSTRKGFSRT